MSNGFTPLKIAITSGKGGVGKSVITSNLAYILSNLGHKTLVFDADSQFPNQHLIYGVEPPVRLSQIYSGNLSIDNAIFTINENLDILADLPAAGLAEYYEENKIISAFAELMHYSNHDLMFFDTPSGASESVLESCEISDIIIILINDEPTSLIDAYGLIKILRKRGYDEKIRLLVNNVIDFEDAEEMSYKLNLATKKFLKKNYESLGFIPYDRNVRKSLIEQELYVTTNPYSEVSKSLNIICENIISEVNLSEIE